MSEPHRELLEAYRGLPRRDVDAAVGFASQALRLGQSHLVVAALKPYATAKCKVAGLWECLGLAYREQQDMEGALAAFRTAGDLDPNNTTISFAYAQVLFETAHDASGAFEVVNRLAPNNPIIIRNHAAALAAEGREEQAEALLLAILEKEPQWLDGHKTLASLRVSAGRRPQFDSSFKAAVAACPQSLSLRLAWIHLLATARDWEAARAVLATAQKDFGPQKGLDLTRVHLASESGDEAGNDPALFDHLQDVSDPGLDLCRIRQALRLDDPARAAAIGQRHIGSAAAAMFWPYLSLAWRLLGDERAGWLDGDPPRISQFDLNLSADELADLSACLKSLHIAQAPYLEQSVHGGTQTAGQLFFRPLAPIQNVRAKICDVVEAYIAGLGLLDGDHPLLGPPRDNPVLFEGSWSVRLKGGGHHSTHTHPKGWISSALYVDVPTVNDIGTPPAGWISFGEGPPELGLGLAPYQQVEPQAGKLVLFPSTLWHRTIPFDKGERLTIAFDVRVPVARASL